MNDHGKLTLSKFQLLKLIDEISRRNRFGVTPMQDLINVVTSQRDIKSGAVRKTVWELSKDGYIENPLRGCWRLTEKGREALKNVASENV